MRSDRYAVRIDGHAMRSDRHVVRIDGHAMRSEHCVSLKLHVLPIYKLPFIPPLYPLLCRYFESVVYSPDGTQLLAGGISKTVCVYSASEQLLLRKYEITRNSSYGESMLVSGCNGVCAGQ